MTTKIEWDVVDDDEEVEDIIINTTRAKPKTKPKTPEVEPTGSTPVILPCGHTDWFRAEEHEEARAAGFCCRGGQKKMFKHRTFVKP
jgi:hypothetical protein